MIETQRRLVFPILLILTALTAGCGGDVVLPEEGEAATLEIVSGDEQQGPAGTTLAKDIVVRVLDTRDRPVPNQDVTFTIGSGGGSVEPATVKSTSAGEAAARWTLGPNSGGHLLRVQTPRGGSGTLEVTVRATAVAGSGSILVGVTGDDQTGPVNSALADSLVVKATDALGNPVADVEVTWSVSGGGSVSPTSVVTGANGLAGAERVLGPTAGPQTAQATVAGFTGSPVTFSHTAVPANPTQLLKVSGDNQTAPGGFEVTDDLVVRLVDGDGNGIGSRAITWTVDAGAGSVTPENTMTDANGFATTRWTLPTAVGPHGVSAVFSGLPEVRFTATSTADVPTTIELVSGNNQSAAVGSALANPLVVRVTDANDNPVASVGVAWTANGGGSVSEDNTATDANGLAQVTRTLGLVPGSYTTTAAVDGLSGSPITFTSNATVGPPAQLAITQQPAGSTTSGAAFSPAFVIQVQDALGNSVADGGVEITASITSGQSASLVGTNPRNTNGSGRATFSGLGISGPPDDDYVITFSTTGGESYTPVSSSPLTVTTGAANRIVIIQQPSADAQSGDAFGQQPAVQIQDASGNPISGNRTVTASLGQGGGDGTLTGTLTASTGGGSTATFTNLAIVGKTRDYTIVFTSPGLTADESDAIALVNNPPSADDDPYSVNEDEVLTVPVGSGVLVGDSDPDAGDNLTAVNASDPANGSVVLQTNGSFVYTPDPDFNGTDTFTYEASDGRGNSDGATVTITVNPVNDDPGFTAGPDIGVSSIAAALGFTDDQWATDISPGPSNESSQTVSFQVSTDNDGAFVVTPAVDAGGTLTFTPALTLSQLTVTATVVAQDSGGAASDPQSFTITIDP